MVNADTINFLNTLKQYKKRDDINHQIALQRNRIENWGDSNVSVPDISIANTGLNFNFNIQTLELNKSEAEILQEEQQKADKYYQNIYFEANKEDIFGKSSAKKADSITDINGKEILFSDLSMYKVKGVENGIITLVDPWDENKEIQFSESVFNDTFDGVGNSYIFKEDNENKDEDFCLKSDGNGGFKLLSLDNAGNSDYDDKISMDLNDVEKLGALGLLNMSKGELEALEIINQADYKEHSEEII